MISSSNTCKAEDIFILNQTKEYTTTATFLLEKVLTDHKLNAQASKLWQWLFNQSRFDKNLEITISYSKLSSILGKSIRTIQRYIKTLEDNKYIVVKNNYRENGSQKSNTIQVRFPLSSIKVAYKTKNRKQSTSSKKYKFRSLKPFPTKVHLSKSMISSNEELKNNSCFIEKDSKQARIPPECLQKEKSEITCIPLGVKEEGGDKIDVPYNNIYIKDNNYINNNKENPVVSLTGKLKEEENQIQNEVKGLQACIEKLKGESDTARIQWEKIRNSAETRDQLDKAYEAFLKYSALDSDIYRYDHKLQHLLQKSKDFQKKAAITNEVLSNPYYMLEKEGNRRLPIHTFRRLVNALEVYGIEGEKKLKLANEIIFEVRFGTLIKSNLTQQELSLDNAVNIALKLVRENRWTTPALLKKECMTQNYH